MSNIDLSLNEILDNRWSLKEIGNGKFKLEFNSFRGLPSEEETRTAIANVLYAKRLDRVYVSDINGDVEITAEQIANYNFKIKKRNLPSEMPILNRKGDILSNPFGAEEDLFVKEEDEVII